jgi:hypothetical protein
MKTKTPNAAPNAAEVWKQMEDSLVPRLRLSVLDRSVYSYLLRYTRLEGKSRLHFSIQWLARGIGLLRRTGSRSPPPPPGTGRFAPR